MSELATIALDEFQVHDILTCDVMILVLAFNRLAYEHGLNTTCRVQRTVNALRRKRGVPACYDILTPHAGH